MSLVVYFMVIAVLMPGAAMLGSRLAAATMGDEANLWEMLRTAYTTPMVWVVSVVCAAMSTGLMYVLVLVI